MFSFLFAALLSVSLQVHSQSDEEKVAAFKNEQDWKLIRDVHFQLMDRLVNVKASWDQFDFNNEGAFLALTGWTRSQYMNKVESVKQAAKRLSVKYGFYGSCTVCNDDVSSSLRKVLTTYQANKTAYEQYKTEVTGLGLDGPTRCCGLRFYLCCTVCAATIAAFPAYLACCALCFDTYCCKP